MNDADTLRAAADLLEQPGVQLWLTQDSGGSASGRNVKAEVAAVLTDEAQTLAFLEAIGNETAPVNEATLALARRILGEAP